MKLWSLCFLVLAMSSISRGQNGLTVWPHNEDDDVAREGFHYTVTVSPGSLSQTDTANETTSPTPSPQSSQSNASVNTSTTAGEETQTAGNSDVPNEEAEVTTSFNVSGSGREDAHVTAVSMATTETSTVYDDYDYDEYDDDDYPRLSFPGYMILVLISLIIISLCVILFFLSRGSRRYSFDLESQSPFDYFGTFEPVHLDDLERLAPKDHATTDESPPVANGTSIHSEEMASSEGNAPQEHPDANGVETPPAGNTSPSLDDDPADKMSDPLSGTSLFFDAIGEQQNENNNPSVCSSDPFVEINLDEPAPHLC